MVILFNFFIFDIVGVAFYRTKVTPNFRLLLTIGGLYENPFNNFFPSLSTFLLFFKIFASR
ncbi:hypothetical protein D9V84_09115 [Bacteroidetes/Chlorobi group bacterium Naka2016]|nr:MAG: hypothetical protein D9V84_09115 [Bacteroidetes/Chlorobi group bacterium Naka2016]